jgi:hypothetical protein
MGTAIAKTIDFNLIICLPLRFGSIGWGRAGFKLETQSPPGVSKNVRQASV